MDQEGPVVREVRRDQQQSHQENPADRGDPEDQEAREVLVAQEDPQQNDQELQVMMDKTRSQYNSIRRNVGGIEFGIAYVFDR